jgi:hypothetical protein
MVTVAEILKNRRLAVERKISTSLEALSDDYRCSATAPLLFLPLGSWHPRCYGSTHVMAMAMLNETHGTRTDHEGFLCMLMCRDIKAGFMLGFMRGVPASVLVHAVFSPRC